MNDYQEYKSYGSYLSRVFAIILAFVLLVLVIWFVVRLTTDDEEATLGDTTTSEIDKGDLSVNPDGEDSETPAGTDTDGEEEGSVDTPSTDEEEGETSSINTDNDPNINGEGTVAGENTDGTLPDTGANATLLIVLPLATFVMTHAVIARTEKQ